jgi:hypothetical protein
MSKQQHCLLISKWKNEELEEAMDVMGKKGNFYEG